MKISFPSVSSFKSKDQILADIETTYIVQVTKGDKVYTVFHINNIEDNDIIYNLEVTETNGNFVKALVIAYNSTGNLDEDISQKLHHFTGKVTSYNLYSKGGISEVDYNDGVGGCEGDGGGGGNGGDDDHDFPDFPSDGDNHDGGNNGDGGSGNNEDPIGEKCWEADIRVDEDGISHHTVGYYNTCTGQYISLYNRGGDFNNFLKADCDEEGSGVIIANNPKDKNDCINAKAIYNNVTVKSRYEVLKTHTRDGNETGYGFKTINIAGGTTIMTEPLNPDAVSPDKMQVIIQPTSFGFSHTHIEKPEPQLAVKIFSPADINTFISYLHNAKNNNIPFSNVFGGMLAENGCQTCYNIYQIQYNGDGADLPTEYTKAQGDELRLEYGRQAQKYVTDDGIVEQSTLQRLFFYFANKMNLKNVVLMKIDKNGNVKKIELNENGDPVEIQCP